MIKIILKKKFNKLGNINDLIKVKNGYALNYLIPNKYAIIATESEVKINNELIKQKKEKKRLLIKKYNKYIKIIKNINIIFYLKKNNNKFFGTITKKDIIKKLEKYKIFINKTNIEIENKEIIKTGKYKIKINFINNINTYLNITVNEKSKN